MVFFKEPIAHAIEYVARCGYDYVEIWMEHLWASRTQPSASEIRSKLEELGLEATVHCPVMDVNIASTNGGIREESIAQYLATVKLAHEIGARLVVLHPGNRFSSKEPLEDHWACQVAAVSRVMEEAGALGVRVAIENMEFDSPKQTVTTATGIRRLAQECGIKDLGVTLDTAHMRATDRVVEFVNDMKESIIHTHISDATSTSLHLLLGEGRLDFRAISEALKSVGYEGVYSLETFIPGDEAMLKREHEKLLALFGN